MNHNGEKFALSDVDRGNGITTIDAKLESLCRGYASMDVLFGGRQNVKAAHALEPKSDSDCEGRQKSHRN